MTVEHGGRLTPEHREGKSEKDGRWELDGSPREGPLDAHEGYGPLVAAWAQRLPWKQD